MNFNKNNQTYFTSRRQSLGAKYLIVPIAFIYLVHGFKKYWLNNDLRYLYKEILKPHYKRIDDEQCVDYRDLKSEIEGNVVDESKSIVSRLQKQVDQKVQEGRKDTKQTGSNHKKIQSGGDNKYFTGGYQHEKQDLEQQQIDGNRDTNLNMIKRF
eukprot:403354986